MTIFLKNASLWTRSRFVQARAVLMATGGGPTMYRYHTPGGDKSCDDLESLILTSRAIARAAHKREESCGAHYRDGHPEAGALVDTTFTVARMEDDRLAFTLVKPGQSLIEGA